MMLRITLWALLAGSILMGFLGIKTGSATTTLVGMFVLAFCAFTLFFIAKMVVQLGVGAVKAVMILVLLIALSFLVYKGCQILFFKTRTAIEQTDTAIRDKKRELKELSRKTGGIIVQSWQKITGDTPGESAPQDTLNTDNTDAAQPTATPEDSAPLPESAKISLSPALPDTGPAVPSDGIMPESPVQEPSFWDKTTTFFADSWENTVSFFKDKSSPARTAPTVKTTAPVQQVNQAQPQTFSGRVRAVQSGYLFQIEGSFIKLYGVDAPDPWQTCLDAHGQTYTCGRTAKQWLERLILNKHLTCKAVGTDGKGNYIATCNIGGYDVGAAMTAVGWAVADRRSSAVYIPYEQQARTGQVGLWAGRFVAPWVARAKHQIN